MSKIEIESSWPESMLTHIQSEAARTDRSLSWCVQKAWLSAAAELSQLRRETEHAKAEEIFRARFSDGEELRQKLFVPTEVATELKVQASRQNRTTSWLLQRAWCLGIETIAKWPSA